MDFFRHSHFAAADRLDKAARCAVGFLSVLRDPLAFFAVKSFYKLLIAKAAKEFAQSSQRTESNGNRVTTENSL
jgi:hypothetical protein